MHDARWYDDGSERQPQEDLPPVRVHLRIHEHVLTQAQREIRANPRVEVGGKFVGWVEGDFDASSADWQQQLSSLRITVLAYLDAGPGKDRSAVHHYSDTEYQFELFQMLARDDPAIQFLGIWHSHHPNGLGELSSGDERTGLVTVNGAHEHDFLLSSLAVDTDGLLGGRHFVFLRGHPGSREIDRCGMHVIVGANPVAETVEAAARRLRSHGSRRHGLVQPQASPPRHAAAVTPASPPVRTPDWMAQEPGRRLLAQDQAWFGAWLPGMRPFLRDDGLVWQGAAEVLGHRMECTYHYPPGSPPGPPRVDVRTARGGHSFVLHDLADRHGSLLECLQEVAASLGPAQD